MIRVIQLLLLASKSKQIIVHCTNIFKLWFPQIMISIKRFIKWDIRSFNT